MVAPKSAPSQGRDPLLPPLDSSLRGETGEMLHVHIAISLRRSLMAAFILRSVQLHEVLRIIGADASRFVWFHVLVSQQFACLFQYLLGLQGK